MAVAELVPQVAVVERFPVAAIEQIVAGDRAEEVEMGRLRFVQPREQSVDRPQSRAGETTRLVQPSPSDTTPSRAAAVSSARTTVVPTAITRPPQP